MKIIKLKLKERSYKIIVAEGILKDLAKFSAKLNIGSDAYLISNALIKRKYGKIILSGFKKSGLSVRFKTIPDTEKSKSIETLAEVMQDIAAYDKKKDLFIAAFGGGVVGDLSGFIASIYKRGIPYIQIPTTLLAQVDSAIGGKTAIDLSAGKNLAGAFYQPRLVLSDIGLLKTLDKKQISSGLAEVIKYALIKDPALFAYLQKNITKIISLKSAELEHVVAACSAIKARIVEKDEREEKSIRTILNFGHTIGHAIETAGGFKGYSHGQAVGLGMLAASYISVDLGLLDPREKKKIFALIKMAGLPMKIKGISLDSIINAHYRDKKFIGAKNRFVLIKNIGKTEIRENIPLGIIKAALNKLLWPTAAA
jgi:3-dehydroquinate synthase